MKRVELKSAEPLLAIIRHLSANKWPRAHAPGAAKNRVHLALTLVLAGVCQTCLADPGEVRSIRELPIASEPPHYTANREPLAPSRLIKLPIGSIVPQGWLRHMLELEAQGMVGRLSEISGWCRFEGNAWTDPQGMGHSSWEELPYWLKGYGDLGWVLKDPTIMAESRRWIEAVLGSQQPDGWFGPQGLKTSLEGKPDLWPHMVMLNVLQSYHEATGDPRVLDLMTGYFRWQRNCPADDFLTGYWPKLRAGDNLESVYWLYNRTGEQWLLEVAEKIHRHTSPWAKGVPDWHGVNITQGFREPAVYYLQAKDDRLLGMAERNYQTVMELYGQVPGGGFGADETCRPGYHDPRQGFETCSMVEFMHSFEMLTRISGNALWADRTEEIAFNSLPAAITPDFKALHYLTGANMTQLDRENKSPGIQNVGTMFSFSPFEVYRCCQHNVAHGWPYYAEELWQATADRGLCATLYCASAVTAKVGGGSEVTITENTDYPFRDTIELNISTAEPVRFPLYLRVPRWCMGAELQINGQAVDVAAEPLSYIAIDRTWNPNDTVHLKLPMKLSLRTWQKNHNSVSVDFGPLTFSLKIGERWVRYGGTDSWPEHEVLPTTAWNYALVIDQQDPTKHFEVVQAQGPIAPQPFTPENAPIQIRAKARRLPEWQQDSLGLVGKLQPSPARTSQPEQVITLIPMGCARLRVAAFPTAGTGGEAHAWTPPPTASHCFANDTVDAIHDGVEPASSGDLTIPRFTWWDRRGTKEWVQSSFAEAKQVSSVEVYWFDDTGKGACRVPRAWRVLYQDGRNWKPVSGPSGYGTEKDQYNQVRFEPVTTRALRLEVELQPEFSGGVLEWRVGS